MSTKTTKRKRASAPLGRSPSAASARAQERPVTDAALAPTPAVAAAPAIELASAVESAPAAPCALPTIGLSSNCTVKDAAGLKNELLEWLDEPGSVAIDARSLERIDTAIMQLLCAFVRDRAERNLGVTWAGAPQPLLEAARLLGVGTLLTLPTEAAP